MDLTTLPYQPAWPNREQWKRRRIGLIGPGNIAQSAHLPAYRKLGLNVVAAADINPAVLTAMQQRWGVEALYTDYREMLEKERLDVVDITVHERWSDVKVEAVRAAAAADTHILIQKPLAETYAQCAAMVEAARTAHVKLAVNQNARWAPTFYAAKQFIQVGGLGEPRMLSLAARRPPRGGDVLVNFSVHSMDLVRYLLGAALGREPRRLYALLSEHADPNQRFINVTLDFGDGIQGAVWDDCAGHLNTDMPWELHVAGSDGSVRAVEYFAGGRGAAWIEAFHRGQHRVAIRPRLEGAWQPDAFGHVMADLLDAIDQDREPSSNGDDNLRTVRLVFAARRSHCDGLPVAPEAITTT
ncbi:MAG: Gfo/Idh/MocA family oxidoreductase [Chloroflexi bacterium]|nr:Gfo/Idh/MocA family oxidoreductase [Chloroflexota bacterium]